MAERSLDAAVERLEAQDETLRWLDLYKVDARLVRLLSRPSRLERLGLDKIILGPDLADALAKQTQLTRLELSHVHLGDGIASHLAAALPQMTSLERVELHVREVSKDDFRCVVAAALQLPHLQRLKVGGQAIARFVDVLAEAVVEQGRLQVLDLCYCPIGDDGAAHLAAMLERNRSLSALCAQHCKIGDVGLVQFGQALTRNTTLRELYAFNSNFTGEGFACFADMMGDMLGLQLLGLNASNLELVPGLERNYSVLEMPYCLRATQPFLERNARGYDKARDATLAWLCICRYRKMTGIPRDIGLVIARHVYASRGLRCWIDE